MIDFGRNLCSELTFSGTREWLVTNGIGGFASGTVSGMLTRRYHGLLVAALRPPLGRTLLVAKLDETASYDGQTYSLATNHWADDRVEPTGYSYLDRFHREGTIAVWTYACADALLEKRIWMQQGANTTCIRYTLTRATRPLALSLKTLVNYRDYHGETRPGDWQMDISPVDHGLRVTANADAFPFFLLSDHAQVEPHHDWQPDYLLDVEVYRGFKGIEDHLHAATFSAELAVGDSVTIIVTTDPAASLDSEMAYLAQRQHEQKLLDQSPLHDPPVHDLILATDQFVVSRPTPADPDGQTVIAGYPWFSDWGRDTMISLPGLTLSTGRPDVCRRILRTFAQFIDQGMLPNRFPDQGEIPEYNTVDATLWYFEAMRAYYHQTQDLALLPELFPALAEIIKWHNKGTRYHIHVDPADGLIYAGEPGVQLTWMDAKVEGWVVTPRIGKPVEINALWYNALRFMAEIAPLVGDSADEYTRQADRVQASFQRFWNDKTGYCYDVLDTPDGNDPALRPNQLFAVSLPYSPLTADQQKAVVDICARQLLTSHGLRSLGPAEPGYRGHHGGNLRQQDAAYHQGTVWSWLIGPFASAHLRVYQDRTQARQYLLPLLRHLTEGGCLGSISEIFDGDPPFHPRGCFAQAWSIAEVLRVWQTTQ